MKCQRCGYENLQGFVFCPVCATPGAVNTFAWAKAVGIMSGKLFLAICILMTVNSLAALFAGGLPLFNVLFTVFFWIAYSKATGPNASVTGIRGISGTFFSLYVILYVLVGILLLAAVSVARLAFLAGKSMAYLIELMNSLSVNISGMPLVVTANNAIAIAWTLAAVLMFCAALILVYNIFVMRRMHGFIKSSYQNFQSGGVIPVANANLTRIWLWIGGVIGCLSALVGLTTIRNDATFWGTVADATMATSYILGAILVGKHFVDNEAPENPQY